jgi:hypothetical protein
VSDDWQSTGEIEAHFDDEGPIMAALRWLTTVFTLEDFDTAWREIDPELRLVLVQCWLWGHRGDPALAFHDLEAAASELAAEYPDHELWAELSAALLVGIRTRWPWLDLASIAAAGRPRPVAIGYELVVLAPSDAGRPIISVDGPDLPDPSLQLLMHHSGDARWLVSGLGSGELPRPGWPPSPCEA